MSAPLSRTQPWRSTSQRHSPFHNRYPSQLSQYSDYDNVDGDEDSFNESTIRKSRTTQGSPLSYPVTPIHAIATPRPTLLFAIASDDVNEVRRVLNSGNAGANDQVGPQSALAFTLTNDQLKNKMEIVKTLLAFGADPSALKNPELNPPQHRSPSSSNEASREPSTAFGTILQGMDPATRCVAIYRPICALTNALF
jgi:hypothetical protein